MSLNEAGISILNNKSKVIDNMIDKAHQNGIVIEGFDKSTKCTPNIWRNKLRACGANGILVSGEQCDPDIRGNIIIQCRKAGIKINRDAIAHIGGTTKVDIKFIPLIKDSERQLNATFETAKVEAVKNYRTSKGISEQDLMAAPIGNAAEDVHLQNAAVAVHRGLDSLPYYSEGQCDLKPE